MRENAGIRGILTLEIAEIARKTPLHDSDRAPSSIAAPFVSRISPFDMLDIAVPHNEGISFPPEIRTRARWSCSPFIDSATI